MVSKEQICGGEETVYRSHWWTVLCYSYEWAVVVVALWKDSAWATTLCQAPAMFPGELETQLFLLGAHLLEVESPVMSFTSDLPHDLHWSELTSTMQFIWSQQRANMILNSFGLFKTFLNWRFGAPSSLNVSWSLFWAKHYYFFKCQKVGLSTRTLSAAKD